VFYLVIFCQRNLTRRSALASAVLEAQESCVSVMMMTLILNS